MLQVPMLILIHALRKYTFLTCNSTCTDLTRGRRTNHGGLVTHNLGIPRSIEHHDLYQRMDNGDFIETFILEPASLILDGNVVFLIFGTVYAEHASPDQVLLDSASISTPNSTTNSAPIPIVSNSTSSAESDLESIDTAGRFVTICSVLPFWDGPPWIQNPVTQRFDQGPIPPEIGENIGSALDEAESIGTIDNISFMVAEALHERAYQIYVSAMDRISSRVQTEILGYIVGTPGRGEHGFSMTVFPDTRQVRLPPNVEIGTYYGPTSG